jgi:hypothetical protein
MSEAAPASLSPEDSAQSELETLRAKRAALRVAQAAEAEAGAVAAAVAKERRALADDEARAAARKAFGAGKYAVVEGIDAPTHDIVILKRAHAASFKAFQDKDGAKLDDIEALVKPCVVYPAPEVFDRLVTTEQPAVLVRCAEAVCYLAGARRSTELGKA